MKHPAPWFKKEQKVIGSYVTSPLNVFFCTYGKDLKLQKDVRQKEKTDRARISLVERDEGFNRLKL